MIVIQTDGAADWHDRIGGWAVEIYRDDELIYKTSGYDDNTTNNRMELTAINQALKIAIMLAKYREKFILQTDSEWSYNCLNRNSNCTENTDLLDRIWKLMEELNVSIIWVPRKELKSVDKMAKDAMKLGKKKYAGQN